MTPPLLSVGDTIGPYRIDAVLGARGQGSVYLALDARGFQVALKVPHKVDDPRFHRELEAALGVSSPYVARVWDYSPSATAPYIAYQVVPGQSLEQVLKGRALTLDEACSVFADVAHGLADVHAVQTDEIPQLSHGDVTPDNILVTDRLDAVLIDLGAAKFGRGSTLSDDLFGKFGYFAPEQIRGEAGGPPADVWQLAVCIVHASTGHMPFGRGPGSINRILHETPNLIGLPARLAETVCDCLVREPNQRVSAWAVEKDLRLISQGLWERRWGSVGRVVEVGFDVDVRGVLRRYAHVDTDDETVGWIRPWSRIDVAVNDQVFYCEWDFVIGHKVLEPAERVLVARPRTCPSCAAPVQDLAGTWRAARNPEFGKPLIDEHEDAFCAGALGCPRQAELIFTHFLSKARIRWLWPIPGEGVDAIVALLRGAVPTPPASIPASEVVRHRAQFIAEREAFVASVQNGRAERLLVALGLPGHLADHIRLPAIDLVDVRTGDRASALRNFPSWLRMASDAWWADNEGLVRSVAAAI